MHGAGFLCVDYPLWCNMMCSRKNGCHVRLSACVGTLEAVRWANTLPQKGAKGGLVTLAKLEGKKKKKKK